MEAYLPLRSGMIFYWISIAVVFVDVIMSQRMGVMAAADDPRRGEDACKDIPRCENSHCRCNSSNLEPPKSANITEPRNAPVFNTVGFGIGIALGSAVVLTAIVMTLVMCITDRRRKTDADLKNLEQADKEDVHHSDGTSGASKASHNGVAFCEAAEAVGAEADGSVCHGRRVSSWEASVGAEADGSVCHGRRVSSWDHQDNRMSEDANEIVVVSEEANEISTPESTTSTSQGRRGSRKMSLITLM